MKNKKRILGIALIVVIGFTMIACNKSGGGSSSGGGGKTLNSAEALKEYLDSQPANSPDKPIKVTMNANAPMLNGIASAIALSGKYVSLNLSGDALTTIPDNAFGNTFIDMNTFNMKEGCDTLVSITIPNSVTSIGKQAFALCTNLTSITIPNSVTSIGSEAFLGSGIKSVTIGNGITDLTGFKDCTSLTNVSIPNSVTSIGFNAFYGCKNLTSVTIPNSVTSIETYAFQDCTSLTSVTIPNSVTSIGLAAFSGRNSSLTSVTFEGTIPESGFFAYATPFEGDLRAKFYATDKTKGTPGTYTTTAPVNDNSKWTKQ